MRLMSLTLSKEVFKDQFLTIKLIIFCERAECKQHAKEENVQFHKLSLLRYKTLTSNSHAKAKTQYSYLILEKILTF